MITHYQKWLGIAALILITALSSCTPSVTNPQKTDSLPKIYPDYIGVTIPADIAPMNFNPVGEGIEAIDVVARGSKGGELHTTGDYADFDIDEWQTLTAQNKGGSITFTVCMLKDGKWTQYRDFEMKVSKFNLEDYGLTYRRIVPGYEVGGNIGIYQRNLHNFDEEAILTETLLPGKCFNCHTANRGNPNRITTQVRGAGGGTLLIKDGKQQCLNTTTDSTKAPGSYAYWHPDGRYVAYTAGGVSQSFFVGTKQPIEVFHKFSNVVVLDTETNKLVLCPQLMTPDWVEIFPAFSADGKTIYYSSSRACNIPAEYEKVKCSLLSIPFDAKTATYGEKADTLLNGEKDNCSYVLARPSYDGKWLMYTRCRRGNFPVTQPDADLWMMNLATHKTWPLKTVNSRWSESYHNWSSNSHWFVFCSKRGDGVYTRLYLASVDENGNATKPFLMPQRNPWQYYHNLLDAYNVPDFTQTKVEMDAHETRKLLEDEKRVEVTVQ